MTRSEQSWSWLSAQAKPTILTHSLISRDDRVFEWGAVMDLGLAGRVAIIAAASKGLGRAVAEELAREGAQVAICARTAADLQATASQIKTAAGREVFW